MKIDIKTRIKQKQMISEINALLLNNNNNIVNTCSTYDGTMNLLIDVLQKKKNDAVLYYNIAGTTRDEKEFYLNIGRCLSSLEWIQQFEKYGIQQYGFNPTNDITQIRQGMDISIQKLKERIKIPVFDTMEGHDFEHYCANLLRVKGYKDVEVTQGSGDHGIDILAEKDGISYAFQCKCYSSNIGNSAVQQAHTGKSLYHKDIAVVITNRYFTKQAKAEAIELGVKLWDRDKLIELANIYN